MASFSSDLITVREAAGTRSVSESDSYLAAQCDVCGNGQMAVVASDRARSTFWLRCVTCNLGYVRNNGTLSPAPIPLSIPQGLPNLEQGVWKEVRQCLGVNAATAAVMLCRKILLHIAIEHGLESKTTDDRSPSYYSAVVFLQQANLITPKMRPWVDRIKDVGNEANHELPQITLEVAMDVARFTEQLLKLTYEMDELMKNAGTV